MEKTGPKHSTSVPFSAGVAVPLSVDEKEVVLVPNPVPGLAVKTPFEPHLSEEFLPCDREHVLLSSTLQTVVPFMPPVTLHLKVKVSLGQVGEAAVNCPATSSEERYIYMIIHLLYASYNKYSY